MFSSQFLAYASLLQHTSGLVRVNVGLGRICVPRVLSFFRPGKPYVALVHGFGVRGIFCGLRILWFYLLGRSCVRLIGAFASQGNFCGLQILWSFQKERLYVGPTHGTFPPESGYTTRFGATVTGTSLYASASALSTPPHYPAYSSTSSDPVRSIRVLRLVSSKIYFSY